MTYSQTGRIIVEDIPCSYMHALDFGPARYRGTVALVGCRRSSSEWAPSMGPSPWDPYIPIIYPTCTLKGPGILLKRAKGSY